MDKTWPVVQMLFNLLFVFMETNVKIVIAEITTGGCVFGAVNHLCEGRKPLICSLSLITSSLHFLSAPGSLSRGLGHNVSEDSVVISMI